MCLAECMQCRDFRTFEWTIQALQGGVMYSERSYFGFPLALIKFLARLGSITA